MKSGRRCACANQDSQWSRETSRTARSCCCGARTHFAASLGGAIFLLLKGVHWASVLMRCFRAGFKFWDMQFPLFAMQTSVRDRFDYNKTSEVETRLSVDMQLSIYRSNRLSKPIAPQFVSKEKETTSRNEHWLNIPVLVKTIDKKNRGFLQSRCPKMDGL